MAHLMRRSTINHSEQDSCLFFLPLTILLIFAGHLNTDMTKRFQSFKSNQQHSASDGKQHACRHQHQNVQEDLNLLEAIKGQNDTVARNFLLEKEFSNLEIQDKKRDGTSLFWASAKGWTDIVELLVWKGALISARNKTGCTPLHAACDANHLDVARFLVKWDAPLDLVNRNGDSCLHFASKRGHGGIVRFLLQAGTSVSQTNHSGKTPLQAAQANDHQHVVLIIKEHLKKAYCQNEENSKNVPLNVTLRRRDSSRKRRSINFEEHSDNIGKDKLIEKDRSNSSSPQRTPAGIKPKRDSGKSSKGRKFSGGKGPSKSNSTDEVDGQIELGASAASGIQNMDNTFASWDSRTIPVRGYMPHTYSTFSQTDPAVRSIPKRSQPLKLQSLPFGYNAELNDLSKS